MVKQVHAVDLNKANGAIEGRTGPEGWEDLKGVKSTAAVLDDLEVFTISLFGTCLDTAATDTDSCVRVS